MNKSQADTSQINILVVDDLLDNLELLSTLLSLEGYKVRGAISGQMALNEVEANLPDLILLDINMPHMNGYEVCQHLKAEEKTREIPVIFISALDEVMDKVTAFNVGGVDYISKPFQIEEVIARIENQLTIQRLQKALTKQNIRLQEAEEKYRSIFENAIEGICQTSANGHFISANPALARIYGYSSAEELMTSVTDVGSQLYVQPERRAEFVVYMQRYEAVSNFESQVYCKDGSIIWISENVRIVKDEEGKLFCYEGTVQDITARRHAEEELRRQRRKTELLLLNILPQPIAERLKKKQHTIADNFAEVSVLFADIVDFTELSTNVSATQLVNMLNQIFSAFDRLAERHGLEKIKTIGDAYMVVGGLPVPRSDHAEAIAQMALDMQQEINRFHRDDGQPFRLRIGINMGPVVAGVIGIKKFSYDLWGDTVNVASRMESQGIVGGIQVTAAIKERLEHKYVFEKQKAIAIKGKGKMTTYLLIGRKATNTKSG